MYGSRQKTGDSWVTELSDSLLLIATAVVRLLAFLVLVPQALIPTEPCKELYNIAHVVGCFTAEAP